MKSLLAVLLLCTVHCGGPVVPDPVATPGATDVTCGVSPCPCSGGSTCDLACGSTAACAPNCSGGSTCGVIGCHHLTGCDVQCSGGSHCDYVDCRGATSCNVDCSGGSPCNTNCTDATSCAGTCSGVSPCLMYCGGATSCTFAECSGGSGAMQCPGNLIVCNRTCPTCGDGVCDRIAGETCSSCSRDCGGC